MAGTGTSTTKFFLITLCILQMQLNLVNSTDWSWPKWLDEDIRENNHSMICDPKDQEGENIDRKLGCDCIFSPIQNAAANCASQSLWMENTPTPAHLNVSLSIRKLIFAKNYFKKLDEDTFGNVIGVHELDFQKNQIESISNLNFSRLTKIDLSFNWITNLTKNAFKNCLKLEEINLSYNRLIFIEPAALNQLSLLTRLNLASNQLGLGVTFYDDYEFTLQNMEWLIEVDLSNNTLNDFPTSVFNGTNHIKKLLLGNNPIRFIPENVFSYYPELEELDLSGTSLTTLVPNGFYGFQRLKTLMLNRMRDLETIEKYAFSGLINLNELSCEDNHRLTHINVLAFRADPDIVDCYDSNPKIVKLADSSLSYFEFGLLNWTTLEELILDRNPWNCDCNLQWVAKYNKFNPKETTELRDFRCSAPPPFNGVPVVDLDPEEMLCFSPSVTVAAAFGVLVFCIVLVLFFSLFAMKALGVLPDYFKKFSIFGQGNSLPKYSPLPKPGRAKLNDNQNEEAPPPDLEWDSTDLPPVYR